MIGNSTFWKNKDAINKKHIWAIWKGKRRFINIDDYWRVDQKYRNISIWPKEAELNYTVMSYLRSEEGYNINIKILPNIDRRWILLRVIDFKLMRAFWAKEPYALQQKNLPIEYMLKQYGYLKVWGMNNVNWQRAIVQHYIGPKTDPLRLKHSLKSLLIIPTQHKRILMWNSRSISPNAQWYNIVNKYLKVQWQHPPCFFWKGYGIAYNSDLNRLRGLVKAFLKAPHNYKPTVHFQWEEYGQLWDKLFITRSGCWVSYMRAWKKLHQQIYGRIPTIQDI